MREQLPEPHVMDGGNSSRDREQASLLAAKQMAGERITSEYRITTPGRRREMDPSADLSRS
jgi:hypothetical protein